MHARIIPKATDLTLLLVNLSIARPGPCCRERARDFFQPYFSVSVLSAGVRAVILEFPIQLVGEMDSVCLFEQGYNPRSFFAFLGYGAICTHLIRDTTAQRPDLALQLSFAWKWHKCLTLVFQPERFEKFRRVSLPKLLYEATNVLGGRRRKVKTEALYWLVVNQCPTINQAEKSAGQGLS